MDEVCRLLTEINAKLSACCEQSQLSSAEKFNKTREGQQFLYRLVPVGAPLGGEEIIIASYNPRRMYLAFFGDSAAPGVATWFSFITPIDSQQIQLFIQDGSKLLEFWDEKHYGLQKLEWRATVLAGGGWDIRVIEVLE